MADRFEIAAQRRRALQPMAECCRADEHGIPFGRRQFFGKHRVEAISAIAHADGLQQRAVCVGDPPMEDALAVRCRQHDLVAHALLRMGDVAHPARDVARAEFVDIALQLRTARALAWWRRLQRRREFQQKPGLWFAHEQRIALRLG